MASRHDVRRFERRALAALRQPPFVDTVRKVLEEREFAAAAVLAGARVDDLADAVDRGAAEAAVELRLERWNAARGAFLTAMREHRTPPTWLGAVARGRFLSAVAATRAMQLLPLVRDPFSEETTIRLAARRIDPMRRDRLIAMLELERRLYESALVRHGIAPQLRALLDEAHGRSWSTTLTLTAADAPGLGELRSVTPVPVAAIERVEAMLPSMPGGSIGVAGPRGAGKSTLIRALARSDDAADERPTLGVSVAAPTRYDGREFVLHLFGRLCHAVLARAVDEREPQQLSDVARARIGDVRVWGACLLAITVLVGGAGVVAAALLGARVDGRLLAGIGMIAVAIAVTVTVAQRRALEWASHSRISFEPTIPFPVAQPLLGAAIGTGLIVLSLRAEPTPVWFWGGCAVAAGVAVLWTLPVWTRRAGRFEVLMAAHDETDAIAIAREHLAGIRYQLTVASGWRGGLRIAGVEAGFGGETSLTDRPMTFPELAGALSDFIRLLTRTQRVVIGIDELDKMRSPDDAHRFLDEVKAIFGIDDAYFLVSVSEQAMATFARKDARMRDAFDSAFDEIVHLEPLTWDESRQLLAERVIGLPIPFAALCHVLSGGLPRELIRTARSLVALNAGGRRLTLTTATGTLLARELDGRIQATMIELSRIADGDEEAAALARWLMRLRLSGRPDRADPLQPGSAAAAIARDFRGFERFAAAVRAYFTDDLRRDRLKAALAADGAGSLEELVQARAALSFSVAIAEAQIMQFCESNGIALAIA